MITRTTDRSGVSRRDIFRAAAIATVGASAPSQAPGAEDPLWKLWVRYVTGGARYRPSFAAMFLDPMFVQIETVAADLSLDAYAGYNPFALVTGPPPAASAIRAGGFGNAAPILVENAPDTPWIPSTQLKTGVRTLMTQNAPVFNVLLLNDRSDWPEPAQQAVRKAVEAGKGFVVIHNALADNQTWPWWYQEVTGGHMALQPHDGLAKSQAKQVTSLPVRPVGKHPIVQGLGPLRFANEVAYKGMWQSPKITPLLETTGAASDRIVAWIGPSTTARVVCIQPGASSETHRDPAFRKLVRNAILWAGGRLG